MRRALLGVGVALAALLLVEGGFRAAGLGDTDARLAATRADAESADWLEPHPERLYALRAPLRHADAHAGYYALGEWPFRGRPGEPAPADLARVLVLGDSCVFGVGLHVADTIPERLARELQAAGLPPDRLAVLNLGVPGYSTLQMRALLDEVLARWPAAAVVLYPAAWNDQAPALGANDVARLAAARAPALLRVLRGSATVTALRGWLRPPPDAARVHAAWERGEAPFGPRVPPEHTRAAVAAMIDAARAAGAEPLVVAPAHPAATRARHPRTAADAALVAEVAREHGAELVDAHAVLAASGAPDAVLFSDHVHPSARGAALLAEALADALLALPLPGGDDLAARGRAARSGVGGGATG